MTVIQSRELNVSKLLYTTVVTARSSAGNVDRVFVGVVYVYLCSNRLREGVNNDLLLLYYLYMKTLSTYINDIAVLAPLKEGLLQGQEATIQHDNPWKMIYPVPTTKDFKKDSSGPGGRFSQYSLEWVCPQLLQSALANIKIDNQIPAYNMFDKSIVNSIEIIIKNKVPTVYLRDMRGKLTKLYGVGFGTGMGAPQLKKDCIELLNAIADDPEVIVKCVKCNNYNYNLIARKYKAHYMTFKEIINKF